MIAQHVEGYPNAKSESSPKALANQDGAGGKTGPFECENNNSHARARKQGETVQHEAAENLPRVGRIRRRRRRRIAFSFC